ncbi:hypothetical protein [Castellaniella sp.]|uniref:hypothetical protein n=1 Tax=Castellaniella sp. TaxID=1955812 RepID=UPI003A8D4343
MPNPIHQPQPARNDRGAARQQIHPGYIKAVQAKPDTPTEIYAYPTFVRGIGPRQRALTVPAAPIRSGRIPSNRGFVAAYIAVGVALWAVAANVTPGA